MIEEELDVLEKQLRLRNPRLLEILNPGLNADVLRQWEIANSVFLPQDIFDLYCWRNGTSLSNLDVDTQIDYIDEGDFASFTPDAFFVNFKICSLMPLQSKFIKYSYERAGVSGADNIDFFVRPFVYNQFVLNENTNLVACPCLKTRVDSMPLFNVSDHAGESCFYSSGVRPLLDIIRFNYKKFSPNENGSYYSKELTPGYRWKILEEAYADLDIVRNDLNSTLYS